MLVASVTNPQEIEEVIPLADLIELRLDCFTFTHKPLLPTIFTLRKKSQGGHFQGSEEERLAKIEELLLQEPEYFDIEADSDPRWIAKIAKKFPKTRLIGSFHNFEETPADLSSLLNSMKHPAFSLYKIALTARSTADMLRLMLFAKETKGPFAVISMGEYGKPSRVLAPIVGSLLGYAGLHEEKALHRYSLQTLHTQFRYRSLNQNTSLYALLGDPVAQSPGDQFHNAQFSHNAVYVKLKMGIEELSRCFPLLRKLSFKGLSVTMPLKEAILPYMDAIDAPAQAIGAINTVAFQKRSNIAVGSNTDAPGALNALEKHIHIPGKRLAILGAGGTARAIAYEAKQRGAHVLLFNRTLMRAKALSALFGLEAYPLTAFGQIPYDILINTIPHWNPPALLPHKIVMDVIYEPEETPLLMAAKQAHCLCIYGKEMFFKQALLQQAKWRLPKKEFEA